MKELATEEEGILDEFQKEARHALGEMSIRALKRLSGVPMPNTRMC